MKPVGSNSPITELEHELRKSLTGEVRFDRTARLLYSTDASIYQIEPLGVVFPRTGDELAACVGLAASFGVPVLPRGAGSSLAGQAIGPALILDCSRYLHRQVEIDPEQRIAVVEPGVVLASLDRAAAAYALQFGPDPASAERATVGGSLANNATGAHSILYGMAADHLLSADVILSDGSQACFEAIPISEAHRRAHLPDGGPAVNREEQAAPDRSIEAEIYRAALQIRSEGAQLIRESWPRTWRRASGYNLNYLLPWSPTEPPLWQAAGGGNMRHGREGIPLPYPPIPSNHLNLAPLLAGSEGTLAVIRRATLRLVQRPRCTLLGVLLYPSLAAACEAVPGLLELHPSAIELIPANLIRLARSVPAYAHQLAFLEELCGAGIPAAMLVVEFAGDDPEALRQRARGLGPEAHLTRTEEQQKQVWGVRKAGLGILMSRAGDVKPLPFVEDLSVPVERLGDFVRELEYIFAAHNTTGDFYAHASAGCLHVRPLLDLKTSSGVSTMRAIAVEAVSLAGRLGGVASGEHGDGLARGEWLERTFGSQMTALFRQLKQAADPRDLLNPGKMLAAPPMHANLRYGPEYQARAWTPVMDFSKEAGLVGAVEQCNGAGVCRKADGVMCPSFQATGDEMHSTRGRANLLRAMFSGRLPVSIESEEILREALDLCLACKGCKSECPSAVDMAKLKFEFLHHYYRAGSGRRRPLRDYIFAHVGLLGRFGHPVAPAINFFFAQTRFRQVSERVLGVSSQRRFPVLSRRPLRALVSDRLKPISSPSKAADPVIFLSDPFTEYFYPEVEAGLAAIGALRKAGCQVRLAPIVGTGRTFLSKGMLDSARKQAAQVIIAIERMDPEGRLPVVGVEPSENYTLRDEYPDLLPGDDRAQALARRVFMVDEFLVRPADDGVVRALRIAERRPGDEARQTDVEVLLHGHCYQKAQPPAADGYPTGVNATVSLLEGLGYRVSVIDAGCCGMAGAFGYEAEHLELSQKVGEIALFPSVRRAGPDAIVAAAGISCQVQIRDGTGRAAIHPIRLAM